MNFIGNKKAVKTLTSSLEKGHLNHAYIFSGPQGVGKFTLAKMFALSAIEGVMMNLDTSLDRKDAMLDLIVIKPEIVEKNKIAKERDISIESIRDAKHSISLFPYHGKYKVLIVDSAHRMNSAAQNALLKVLEEPNQTTIIILVTNEIDRILPTILSRCQMVNFSLVDDSDMASLWPVDIAALAVGRPGLAMRISSDIKEKEFYQQSQSEFEKITNGSLNERFILADEYSKNIVKTLEKLNIWIWEMRKKALNGNENQRGEIYCKIDKIQKAVSVLKRTNANSKLILETLFMDL